MIRENIGRMLCFVQPKPVPRKAWEGDVSGWILQADGAFIERARDNGESLEDHDFQNCHGENGGGEPLLVGLLIFEGWVSWTAGPEPDVYLTGQWRRLSYWEVVRVTQGMPPWEKPLLEEQAEEQALLEQIEAEHRAEKANKANAVVGDPSCTT